MPSEQRYSGPGWDLLSDYVDERVARQRDRTPFDRLMTKVPAGTRQLMMRAAQQRGLSAEAYLRRCLVAVLAHDLDLDWWELLVDEPWITGYGAGFQERKPYAGAGFGNWHIDGMSQVADDPR